MTGIVPPDAEFRSAFERASVSKNKLARYYLRALERTENGDSNPELVINPNPDEVNLEHVLPESPHANWPQVTAEIAATYTHRIGNLALMGAQKNRDAGNLSFASKKAIYAKSNVTLTKALSRLAAWGPEQIERRQKRLAELAVKTWPLTM